MKIFISLSGAKAKFTKDDRVVVRLARNEWRVGSVTRSGASVYVLFDDGSKATISGTGLKFVRAITVAPGKTRKRSLDDDAAKLLFAKPAVENKIVLKKPGTPRSTKLVPSKDLSTKLAKASGEEGLLMAKAGSPGDYARASTGRAAMHAYLTGAWNRANSSFFANKLRPVQLRFSKDMGTGFRRRGAWHANRRTISISPRLFLSEESKVLTTLVHEMCHQWVSEVDGVNDRSEGGHGSNWQSAMRRCGLTPSRYSKYDNLTFMTEDERGEAEEVKQRKADAVKQADSKKIVKLSPYELRNITPAQYFDAKANAWCKGLIVGRNDLAGKRWNFIVSPTTATWQIIPADWFYRLQAPAEAAEYARTIRQILRYLDVCDGNLEEGSLRCDCNVSVRKPGAPKFGTKVEIKNINSFRFVEKAIEYERMYAFQ